MKYIIEKLKCKVCKKSFDVPIREGDFIASIVCNECEKTKLIKQDK